MFNQKICPDCRTELKQIVYGMMTEELFESGDYIPGGCLIDGLEPHWGCDNCGYRGFLGGREYKTRHTKPGYKPGTENSLNPEIIELVFDVIEASDEELWGWSEGLWEARLELLHRGISKAEIEAYGEQAELWDAMPFEETELGIIQYDPATQKIIGIEIFYAHGKTQSYSYRLPGMDKWGGCYTVGDFHHVQTNFPREANLETWQLILKEGQSDDAFWEEESDLDHPLVKQMLASENVSKENLEKYSPQFERFFIWPSWFFEPTIAFALGKRSFMN